MNIEQYIWEAILVTDKFVFLRIKLLSFLNINKSFWECIYLIKESDFDEIKLDIWHENKQNFVGISYGYKWSILESIFLIQSFTFLETKSENQSICLELYWIYWEIRFYWTEMASFIERIKNLFRDWLSLRKNPYSMWKLVSWFNRELWSL